MSQTRRHGLLLLVVMASIAGALLAKQPTLGSAMNTASTDKPEYFARVNFYVRPIRPDLPITRAEAEARDAFYAFYRRGLQVQRAEQWLMQRTPCPGSFKLPTLPSPGVHLFSDDGSWRPLVSLEDLAFDAPYLVVTLERPGAAVRCEQVSKRRILQHIYRYRDDGSLSRLEFQTESDRGVDNYGEDGQLQR